MTTGRISTIPDLITKRDINPTDKEQQNDSPHHFYRLISQSDYAADQYAASKYSIIKQLALPLDTNHIDNSEGTIYYVVLDRAAQLATESTRMAEQITKLRAIITEEHAKKVAASQQAYIQVLHDYNDLKDCTQSLLGVMAMKDGVTVESLYPQYDLDLQD